MTNINIRTYLEEGPKDSCYNFYDWFCKETSLKNKSIKLTKYLKQIKDSPKIDIDKYYVFFKNNYPVNGSLYDDLRICDMKTGEVIYTIVPKCGHKSSDGLGCIWGRQNNFDSPLIQGTWKELKQWFNNIT